MILLLSPTKRKNMLKNSLLFALAVLPYLSQAQFFDEPKDTSWKKIYRMSEPKVE
jgi:hypothetical protein